VDLAAPSERLPSHRADEIGSPLIGFVLVGAPLPTYRLCVHSPTTLPPPFGRARVKWHGAFRPRGFSPPRRFTPRSRPWVCCAPKPDGIRCVSRRTPQRWLGLSRRPLVVSSRRLLVDHRFPQRVYTPRRIPLASSRTASPRPLPSCRFPASNRPPGLRRDRFRPCRRARRPLRAPPTPLPKQWRSAAPVVP